MRAENLDKLRSVLLFNNTVDVWMTMCNEKGWEWRDPDRYQKFIEYLRQNGVSFGKTDVKHPIKGFAGKQVESHVIKLDDATVVKIRNFTV